MEDLINQLNEIDQNRDIWVPEPGYQKEKSEKDVIEMEVDSSTKGEAQFDWEEGDDSLVVKGASQSDEEFNKEIKDIANEELDADEAYIRMYQEMLKEGRRDGDDPLKKDVALNSILNLLLEQSETGTKKFEEFINDRQISSFEDVFFEILAQGNTIIRDTNNQDVENEIRNLMNILQRYKQIRKSNHRSLEEMDKNQMIFAKQFTCGVDSNSKCRRLVEEEENTSEKEEIVQREPIIIDETKDLQKGIKWLLSYIPTDVDDDSLREIGTNLIDTSIDQINKFEENFQEEGFEKMQNKFKSVKDKLGEGASLNDTELHNHIQNLKKMLNDKIDFLLTKENRDKEASALARIEDSLQQFDEKIKGHQGDLKEGGNNAVELDHEIEDKLESVKNQLESTKKSDQRDWKAFRKNIKELVNYELSNVKENEATKKINNISTSVKNILDSLGGEIENGTLKYSSKESTQNLIDDLKSLKDSYKQSGLIIDADQYKSIVKEFFTPVKELLDDSGKATIAIDANKFQNSLDQIKSISEKLPNKIPHTHPGKEMKQFKWVRKDLPEGSEIKPEDEDKTKVKYENGLRYELVQLRKIKPDYLDSAEGIIIDAENSGQGVLDSVKEFLNSVSFKNKMSKIMDRLQKAYFFANEQTGEVLQDTNIITRIKQGYYLHKPVARLLRSIILARKFFDEKDLINKNKKARKLGINSTFDNSLEQKDSDMMLYLQTRLSHSLKNDFKTKTLESAYNSLMNTKNML